MRLLTAYQNIKYSVLTWLINFILKFISRIVFINYLSIEYMGINGLFTNLIMLLSVADLGIGTAVVYNLYKPIADKNIETIKSLMSFLKKTYTIIGCLIIFLGICLVPYLDFFIKDTGIIPNLHYIYLIFLFNTGISYFWSYKKLLLIADQKNYICSIYQSFAQVFLNTAQILSLIAYSNYYLYIILILLTTIGENIFVARKVDKIYPFLQSKIVLPLKGEISSNIKKNVKAIILHKIGSTFEFSISNLVISKFLGLSIVGIYSNYNMVIWTIETGTWQIISSITASIGNLIIVENSIKKVEIYKVLEFINSWLASIIAVGLYVLFNSFIELWIGQQYLLDEVTVIWLIICCYIMFMRKAVLVFKDASGLFWNDRYKTICYAMLNLCLSVFFVQDYGILGVIWGWLLSTLLTCFWVEPYVLFNNSIDIKLKDYFKNYFKYAMLTLILSISTQWLYRRLFAEVTIINFLLGVLLCIGISNIVWILVFRKREEMKYLKRILKNKFKIKFL